MNFQKITSILCFIFFCITLLAQNKLEIYSPIEYNNKAHELLEEDEPDFLGAEKQFAKINENDSLYFEALYNRAYCLRSASKFEEALVVIEEGIQLNKEFLPDFYINKVSCLDSLKQYDKAIMVISEAVKRFPFNNDLNIAKGQVLESQGKYLETFEIYKQQILSAPLDVNGHLNMANLMIKSNALSQAILPLTTAIALYPERANNLNIIQTLEVIVSAKYDKEPIMDLSQLDGDFNEVDELISNYIALSDKYRINSKINYGYIKQLHLLLSEADDTKTDFFTTTYLNTLKPFLDDRFAHLAGLLSLSSKNKSHQAYCEKNMKGISEVYLEIRSKMNDLGGQIESPDPYIEGMVNYMFTSDGSIEGFGKQDPKTKNFYGKVVYISEDGAIQCRGELNKDALPINEWNWYYANGNTSRTSSFKNGKLDGPTQFFTENGTLSRTSNFKDDVLHGKVESYKLIGYKYEETNYVNGKQEGLKTGFYPDGSKSYEFHMKNDLEDGKYTYYYDDQSISNEGEAKEGELIGTALTYFRNGQISYSEEYLNGLLNGKYESYYQNGQLETKGLMKDGNKAGTWNTYSRSGKISSVEEYDFKGKKNGVIQLYDYKGRIENELTFKKGFCQSVTNYDSLGQVTNTHKILKNKLNFTLTNNLGNVVKKSTIIDGKLQGPYSYYNAHGQINVIEEYVDDLIQGKVLSYYYNGELYS